jgi:hypothetical protein
MSHGRKVTTGQKALGQRILQPQGWHPNREGTVQLLASQRLITTLIALQKTQTGVDTRRVLVIDVPALYNGKTPQQVLDFYKETIRRIDALPGVTDTAVAAIAP